MPTVALDTNGYVEILRGSPRASTIRAALSGRSTSTMVLMPVIAELLQGARTEADARSIRQRLVDVVPPARRIVADPAEWARTGEVVAAMKRNGHDPAELARRSFYLDVHVAVVCRARGITFLTDDQDHQRITPYTKHVVVALP